MISPRLVGNPEDFLAPNNRSHPDGGFGGSHSHTPKGQLMINKSKSALGPSSSLFHK
jgi:hypothetical protein